MSAIFISHSTKDNADAAAMGAWLEEQGHKSYFIDYNGICAGTDWEQVLYQRMRQCHALVALVSLDWIESKWCFSEMIQAREKGKPIFPVKVKPCELPGLLSDTQSIDLTADRENGYRRLAQGLKENGLDPTDVFVHDLTRPPYPGFPAFEESDAAVFFGRSADILSARETIEGLRRHGRGVPRLLLILGSSGSGKSSLVRAGLIPRIKKDEKNWLPLRPFRPQDELNPLDALAFAIADTYKDLRLRCDSDLVRSRLRSASESIPINSGELLVIARELASAADHREATVLVTVDQAEELLNSGSQETGKTFLRFLGASLSAGDRHLMAVATLRSDSLGGFQNQVASLDSVYRLGLEHRPLTVEPIPIERYAALIEGPARVAGLELENSLVLKLLREAGQFDSLPLLAFTLRRLYDLHFEGPQANRHAKLTLREYEELGGLAEAVQNAAERIFKEPLRTTDEINAFREALIPGLIRYNEDRSYSRRRAFRDELPPGASSLLDGFVDARLLVRDVDKQGRTTLEVAHEALLRTWPALTTWLIEDRDKLRQHNAIVRAAKEWDESGRKTDLLVHRDGRLKDAAQLISERRFAFLPGSVEHTYLAACVTDQQAREAAAQEERERRLRAAQRFAGILAVVALIAAVAATFAFLQRREAKKETKRAVKAEQTANEQKALAEQRKAEAERQARMATEAQQTAEKQTVLAKEAASQANVLLAFNSKAIGNYNQEFAYLAIALKLNRTNSEAGALTAALLTQESWPVVTGAMKHDDAVYSAQFSPDGQRVVTASYDKTARVWDAATGKALSEPMKHDGAVSSAQFSPDGQRVVTASDDNTARVWDAATGKALGEPMKHDAAVSSAQFSPDGQRVVTASYDKTARVWDAATGKALSEPMKHDGAVSSAQFSPDGQRVVTASDDKTARVWDAATGKALGEPMKHDAAVSSAQFSPDGQRVVTASGHKTAWGWDVATGKATSSGDGTARVWDAATGKPLSEPMKHDGEVHSAQFSPDGQRVVTASGDGRARVWDAATGKALSEPMKHDGEVSSAQFSPDGQRVVTASGHKTASLWDIATGKGPSGDWGTARVWDAATGKALSELMKHDGEVYSAQFSPDGQRVVTASGDKTARVWDVATGEALSEPIKHDRGVPFAQFSPDGQRVVTASWDGTARVWDAATGKALSEPMKHDGPINSAQFSPDGQRVVTASYDTTARVWDAATGKALGEPMKHGGQVYSAQFSPDGQRVVTASYDTTARVWDAATGKALGEPMKHHLAVNSAQFSADGQRVVTASSDKTARVWDAATGKAFSEPMKHHDVVHSAQFSADGQRVVTACGDEMARVWEAATGKALSEPMKHDGPINSAQFSADGQRVVTASADKTARVWDAATGKALSEPMKHDGPINSAQFSPDGQRVVTASDDNTARVWDAATGKALSEPMKHDGPINSAQFSADGQRVVTASDDNTARVWDVPTITRKDSADDANLFADLAEATGGLALQAFGQTEILTTLTSDQVRARRDEIAAKFQGASSELTPLQRFLKWSVSGARTRTISPFSDLTVADWVKNRIKEGTLNDLSAAMLVDPANARLAANFGMALANLAVAEKTDPDVTRRAWAEADYQTRRAVKLASDNDEVKKLRAEVVKLLQLPE